jgi:hypothetical protein
MTRRTLNALRFAMAAAAGTICLFINDNMSSAQRSNLITQADAEIGQPWTAMSGAGVARRHARRAYYCNAGYYGAYTAGYPAGYYGGYANYSHVTGRTLLPRYYNAGWAWIW